MKPSDNEIEMLATGFAIQHKNGLIRFAHALLDKYAPQASAEDVRNAALEEAAAVAKRISDKYAFGLSSIESATADEIEREILALKQPQAEKNGGQQRNWVSDWSAAIKSLPMGRSEGVVDKSPNLQGSSVDRSTDLQDRGDDVVLPPLPSPPVHRGHALFAGSQMQTYARAAVLADRQQRAGDAVRDALWTLTEHNALHFGEQHSTVIQGRAALSALQAEQGDTRET